MFGFVIGLLSTLFGFAVIWDMWLLGIFSIVGVIACIIIKSFNTETDYYIKAAEVAATESGQTEGGAL